MERSMECSIGAVDTCTVGAGGAVTPQPALAQAEILSADFMTKMYGPCMGHTYIGHNYRGRNYAGHNYVGHNYITAPVTDFVRRFAV